MVYLEYGTIEKITLTTSAYTSFHTRLSGLAYVPEFYVLLATHNCEKAIHSFWFDVKFVLLGFLDTN